MKEIISKIWADIQSKSDPNRPLLTAEGVKHFVLHLLLGILMYAIVYKFIVKISIVEFVFIDILFSTSEYFSSLVKKK